METKKSICVATYSFENVQVVALALSKTRGSHVSSIPGISVPSSVSRNFVWTPERKLHRNCLSLRYPFSIPCAKKQMKKEKRGTVRQKNGRLAGSVPFDYDSLVIIVFTTVSRGAPLISPDILRPPVAPFFISELHADGTSYDIVQISRNRIS